MLRTETIQKQEDNETGMRLDMYHRPRDTYNNQPGDEKDRDA